MTNIIACTNGSVCTNPRSTEIVGHSNICTLHMFNTASCMFAIKILIKACNDTSYDFNDWLWFYCIHSFGTKYNPFWNEIPSEKWPTHGNHWRWVWCTFSIQFDSWTQSKEHFDGDIRFFFSSIVHSFYDLRWNSLSKQTAFASPDERNIGCESTTENYSYLLFSWVRLIYKDKIHCLFFSLLELLSTLDQELTLTNKLEMFK